MTRTESRFEKDPQMAEQRSNALSFIDNQKCGCYQGDLELLVKLVICERWLCQRKVSYGYELAWIFDRDRGTIRRALLNLEEKGEIVRLNRHGTPILYKPSEEEEDRYLKSATASN